MSSPAGLPKPGEILHLDFRTPEQKAAKGDPTKPIKLLQWNIERGYKLDAIIEELKTIKADVLALQEIDIGCDRSAGRDTGVEIAQALGLNYAFICEFEEHRSPLRDAMSQGGGVHGNALLSRYDLSALQAVEHTCHPIDWDGTPDHELCRKEPRKGRRLTLVGTAHTPQGPLAVYSAHLEVFCGMLARMHQFSDILRHCRQYGQSGSTATSRTAPPSTSGSAAAPATPAVQGASAGSTTPSGLPHQAIMGDLNTMAHGVARLSKNYCCDRMRWRTLWWAEGEIWDRYVLACMEDPRDPFKINTWLHSLGLPEGVCRDILNPGFKDPFDVSKDVTLDHPKYRLLGIPFMAGKLDWALLRNMEVVSKSIGNHKYDKSDHKWLAVEVNLKKE